MVIKLIDLKNTVKKKSSITNIFIWIALTFFSLIILYLKPIFELNENQILYLFSSASQVIAAIYGLIITGYIFLRNELDRKVEKDESLEEIVTTLKSDYFDSIILISLVTILSISLCFLVIADTIGTNRILLDILINVSVSLILTQLILIVSFVIKILNPNSLELASNKLKKQTTQSETGEKGSIEDFLSNYNWIEYILTKYGTSISDPEIQDYDSAKQQRISNKKLVNILYNDGRIDNSLRNNLFNLITFRNSFIHSTNLFLSKKDVEFSKVVLDRLKNALGVV